MVVVFWLAAFCFGIRDAGGLETHAVVQGIRKGLTDLMDRKEAEKYLKETLPKLEEIIMELKSRLYSVWGKYQRLENMLIPGEIIPCSSDSFCGIM